MSDVLNGTHDRQFDIVREGTKVWELAHMLSDKRRKNGATRQEIQARLGFDPAPYVTQYKCFKTVSRGRYVYVGRRLSA